MIHGDGSRVTSVSALPIGSGKDAFVSKLGELFLWLSAYSLPHEVIKSMVFPVYKIKPKLFTNTGKFSAVV